MELSFERDSHAEWVVLSVTGEVDVETAPSLRSELQEICQPPAVKVALDLRKVAFLDSTGLGVLVGAHNRLQDTGGAFVVVCDSPIILKVFAITGLDSVMAVRPTVEDAVSAA